MTNILRHNTDIRGQPWTGVFVDNIPVIARLSRFGEDIVYHGKSEDFRWGRDLSNRWPWSRAWRHNPVWSTSWSRKWWEQ